MAVRITKYGLQSYAPSVNLGTTSIDLETGKVTRTGGGGGGSSTTTTQQPQVFTSDKLGQSFSSKEAMEKAETEAKAKAEAQAKANLLTQQQIQSQTLGGQLNETSQKNTANVISAYDPYASTKGLTLVQAIKTSGGRVVDIITGRGREEGERRGVSYVTSPFSSVYFGKPKAERYTGEINYDPMSQSTSNVLTFKEVQAQREQSRANIIKPEEFEKEANLLQSSIQAKINEGYDYELATSEYEIGLADINKRYTSSQTTAYNQFPDITGLGERRSIGNVGGKLLDVGVGTASVLLSPATGGSSLVAGGLYFGVKGVSKAIESPSYKEQFIDIRQGASDIQSGIKRDELYSPLYDTYKGKRREGAVDLLAGASLGVGSIGTFEKGIVAEEFANLGKSQINIQSVTAQSTKSSDVIIKGTQQYGGLSREINIRGTVYNQGGNQFIMPTGVGTSTTRGQTSWILNQNYDRYVSTEVFEVGSKGLSIGKNNVLTVSKDTFRPVVSVGGFYNQGQTAEDLLKTSGLKLGGKESSQLSVGISKKVASQDGLDLYVVSSGKYEGVALPITPQSSGRQIVYQTGKEGKDFFETSLSKDILSFQGGGKKSGLSFVDDLSKKTTPPIYKQPSKFKPSSGNGGSSGNILLQPSGSQYSGTGLYERTESIVSLSRFNVAGEGISATQIRNLGVGNSLITPSSSMVDIYQLNNKPTLKMNIIQGIGLDKKTKNNLLIKSGYDSSLTTQLKMDSSLTTQLKMDSSLTTQLKMGQGLSVTSLTIQTQIPKQKLEPILKPVINPVNQRVFNPKSIVPRGFFTPVVPPFTVGLNLRDKPSRKSQIRKQQLRYQPSLTASVLNIKGRSTYLGKGIGYNPFELRGLDVVTGKKVKKKGKKKRK